MLDFTVKSLNTHFAQASVQLPACNLHTSVAFHTPRRMQHHKIFCMRLSEQSLVTTMTEIFLSEKVSTFLPLDMKGGTEIYTN